MNSGPEIPLSEQRLALRAQLLQQRQLIVRQLDPKPVANTGFPRSITLRFLMQDPDRTARVIAELATMLLGGRLRKSAGTIIVLLRLIGMLARKTRQDSASTEVEP